MKPLTFEQLRMMGWEFDETKGIRGRTFTSLCFRLSRDGITRGSVPGYGRTRHDAMRDAVREANSWLRRQPRHEIEPWLAATERREPIALQSWHARPQP